MSQNCPPDAEAIDLMSRIEFEIANNPPNHVPPEEMDLLPSVELDLSRVELIRGSPQEKLDDPDYLESLIIRMGLNREIVKEQPEFVNQFGGGLYIWQYPNQFSKYLGWLRNFKIKSYLEIGCRWGGTFVLTCEFLKKKCDLEKSVALDVIDSPVKKYCMGEKNSKFIRMDSQSEEFKSYMNQEFFDMVLIDGHHGYFEVASDYLSCRNRANILVFHDIASDVCPGVVAMWKILKETKSDEYEFYEAKDQYEEVFNRTGMRYLGIGMAVKKDFVQVAT